MSDYKECVALYFDFYETKEEVKPKMTGAEGNALKQLIVYLKTLGKGDAVVNFRYILDSWNTLVERENWYYRKYDIKIINSQINHIVRTLKSSNGSYAHPSELETIKDPIKLMAAKQQLRQQGWRYKEVKINTGTTMKWIKCGLN